MNMKRLIACILFLVVGSMLVAAADPPKGVESEIVTEEGIIISYGTSNTDGTYDYYTVSGSTSDKYDYIYNRNSKKLYRYDPSIIGSVEVTDNENLVRAFSDGLNSKRKAALESARRLQERIDCNACLSNRDISTELDKYKGDKEGTEILKRMYTKIYSGRDLVDDVKGELSLGDEDRAVAILSPPATKVKGFWNGIPLETVRSESYETTKNRLRGTRISSNLESIEDEIGQSAAENLIKLAVKKGEGTIIVIDEHDTGLLDITGIGVKYYDAATLKEVKHDANRATDIIRSRYLERTETKIAYLEDIKDDADLYSRFQGSIQVDQAIDLRLANQEFRSELALRIVKEKYVDTGILGSDDNPTFLFYKRKSDNSLERSMVSYEQVISEFPLSKQEFKNLFSGHTDYDLEGARQVVQSYRRWVSNSENKEKQTSEFWQSEVAKKTHQATDTSGNSRPRQEFSTGEILKSTAPESQKEGTSPSPAPVAAAPVVADIPSEQLRDFRIYTEGARPLVGDKAYTITREGNLRDDSGNVFDAKTGKLISSVRASGSAPGVPAPTSVQSADEVEIPTPLEIADTGEIAEPGKLTDDQFSAVGNEMLFRSQDKASEFKRSIEERGYYRDPRSGATIFRTGDGKIKVYYFGGKVLELTDEKAGRFLEVGNPIDTVNRDLFIKSRPKGGLYMHPGKIILDELSERRVYATLDGSLYELLDDGTIIFKEANFEGDDYLYIKLEKNRFNYDGYIRENPTLKDKLDSTVGSTYYNAETGNTLVVAEFEGNLVVYRVKSFTVSHYPPNFGIRVSGEPNPNVVSYFKDDLFGNVRFVKDELDGHWEFLRPDEEKWTIIERQRPVALELFERHPEVITYQFKDSDEYDYRQLRSGRWQRMAKGSDRWELFDGPETIQRLELLRGAGDLKVLQGLIIRQPLSTQRLAAQQILDLQGLRKDFNQLQADAENYNQKGDELFDKYLKAEKTKDKEEYLAQAQANWDLAVTAQKRAAGLARMEGLREKTDSLALIKEDLQTFARGGRSAEVAALEAELKKIKGDSKEANTKREKIEKQIEDAKTSQEEITHSEAYHRAVDLSNRIQNQLGSDLVTQLRLTANFEAESNVLKAELKAAGESKDPAAKDKKAEIEKRIGELDQKQTVDRAKLKAELDKKGLTDSQARELLKESDEAQDYAQKVDWQGDWMQNIILKLGGSSTVYNALVKGDYVVGDLISGVSGLISKVGSYQPLSNLLIPDVTKDWQENANTEFIQRFANYDAFMAEAVCLDDDELRSEQPGQTSVFIKTRGGTFQHVAALSAERSGDDEKLFVACTRNEETEELSCRSGEGNEDDQICKENGFCYANRDAEEPVKGLFYKISWGVTAPADDSFTPYVDEAGNAMKFNIGLKKRGFSTFTWLYESDEAFGKNVIVLANGESDKDTLAFYSDIDYEEVCIAINEGYRPISYHSGAGLGSPFEKFKPVEDICKSFIKLQGKEVDFLASNRITSSKSPSKGNVKRNRQI